MNVTWVHFPLHPDTPENGISIADLFAGRDLDLDAMYMQMKGLMDVEGLPYNKRTHTYNSRLAQELGKWADTQPQGDAFHDAMFTAFFVSGMNIGDVEVLRDIAASVGLAADGVTAVLEERVFSPQIDADWAKSRQLGVTGVPTFVAGGYGVVGAQSYETLASLLDKVGAQHR